ncbi:MAG: FtsW/RodA/SpoVE family cell cycle protein [Flavobacteriales bacterium]|nr:FtsW/RodA/SpoVE family cell cycle protein [Flavobacteriales bacterium]
MKTFISQLRGDRTIWMVALFLGLISLLAVYSSISSLVVKRGGSLHLLFKHAMMLVTGGVIMYYASQLRHTMYSRLSMLGFWPVVGLLGITLVFGSNINDASRWVEIPGSASASKPVIRPRWSLLCIWRVCWASMRRNYRPSAGPVALDDPHRCGMRVDPSRQFQHGSVDLYCVPRTDVPWESPVEMDRRLRGSGHRWFRPVGWRERSI